MPVSVPEIRPVAGIPPEHRKMSADGIGFAGSFAAILASEMPALSAPAVLDLDWMAYRRAIFTTDEDQSRKRLKALRRRDPALAARLERILRLPVWEQPASLAEAAMSQSRRVAQTQPGRPGETAHFATRAMMARSISLTSVFDRPDLVRWA
jgi:hypothetical protein